MRGRAVNRTWTVTLALFAAGCSIPMTGPSPKYVAEAELVPSYHDKFELSAGGRLIAEGSRYDGLARFVSCVPQAKEHAESAESAGAAAGPLLVTGEITSVAGLGGLSGLAFYKSNDAAMAAFAIGRSRRRSRRPRARGCRSATEGECQRARDRCDELL